MADERNALVARWRASRASSASGGAPGERRALTQPRPGGPLGEDRRRLPGAQQRTRQHARRALRDALRPAAAFRARAMPRGDSGRSASSGQRFALRSKAMA